MEVVMALKGMRYIVGGIVFLLLLCGSSFADEFHYNNFLIGDRASGMGGAYTAISDDPSGLYYNPAGAVYATGKNLSASVNAYYSQKKKYDNVIGGQGWERNSSSLLPNFFGITQPLGSLTFGFSYAVPDSILENQNQVLEGSFPTTLGSPATMYTINFNNEDTTYNFGPSLAAEINSKLSVGMTLYLYHRSNQTVLNQLINLQDGRFEWSNQYINLVERGYRPVLGVMWSPGDKWTIGLSVAKTMLYSESKTSQVTFKDANALTPNEVSETFDNVAGKRKFPLEMRAGVAYFASNSLLVSADGSYYSKVTDENFGDRVKVLNGAVGMEYYLDKKWAVRGGLFSNLANTPELQALRTNQDEKIDLYGVSASVSNFSRNTSITLGGSYTKGSGQAQLLGNSTAIQDVKSTGWMMYLSSSYSY
jgi:long-subunit fatty acid transport protein